MDEFEQKLQRQPLRRIPADWREEILREGRRAAVLEIGPADTAALPKWSWPTTLLWPHPKAWAWPGGDLGFDSGGEFFRARQVASCSGELRATVAGSRGGFAAAAADAGGIDRPA